MTDDEQEKIAEDIKAGCTSGRVDTEIEDTGTFHCVAWSLSVEEWAED